MGQRTNSQIPWAIMGVAAFLAFAMWSPMYAVPPMEHILKEELAITHTQTGLLFSAPFLMIIAISIPAGLLADKIGVRKAAGIGAVILAVGSILRATATSATSLLVFTFIYGVGLGWAFANLPKLVSAWVPREKAGVATGIYSSGIFAGCALPMAITMPLIFPITNTFQGVFLVWGIPPIAATILWWILIREPPRSHVSDESVTKNSVSLRRVFGNRNLWLLAVFFMLSTFFIFTWSGWTPALLLLKGVTVESAGLISSVTMWASIPTAFLLPRLAYKLGLRKPFLWMPGFILAIISWAVLHVNLTFSWLIMGVAGVAHNTRFMSIMALPVEMMPKEDVGTASGLVFSVGFLGGFIGPLIGGRILDLTGNLDICFYVLIGLSLASAGLGLMLPETGPKARSNVGR